MTTRHSPWRDARPDEWDAASAARSQPATEGLREAVEQWVELFHAYNRGEDLRPIFDRHIAAASDRVRVATEPAATESEFYDDGQRIMPEDER